MKASKEFPFSRARPITTEEVQGARRGIAMHRATKVNKIEDEAELEVSLSLHPKIIAAAKAEAKKRHMRYQAVIQQALLEAFHLKIS